MSAEPTISAGFSLVCWFCRSTDDLREQGGHLVCGLCFNEPGRAQARRLEEQRAEEAYFWHTCDDEDDDPDGRRFDTGDYEDDDYYPEDDEEEEEQA